MGLNSLYEIGIAMEVYSTFSVLFVISQHQYLSFCIFKGGVLLVDARARCFVSIHLKLRKLVKLSAEVNVFKHSCKTIRGVKIF